jgi:predicted ArsR family transcriptional regulator
VSEDRKTDRTERDPTANQQRLTVHDAARKLGISEDAVRMRIKRGTLSSDKEGGRLYVLLDAEPTTEPTTDRTDELIEELRGRVQSLEDQLGQERDANRENRRIIAALTSRIPAIEAPPEARESPQTVEEEPERAGPRPATGEAQEGTERRPWWRRMFGG